MSKKKKPAGNPRLDDARARWQLRTVEWDLKLFKKLVPLIARGMTQRQMAEELNRRKVPTRTGKGVWSQTQIKRVLARLKR
jgi:DNA polymerase III delta subunit